MSAFPICMTLIFGMYESFRGVGLKSLKRMKFSRRRVRFWEWGIYEENFIILLSQSTSLTFKRMKKKVANVLLIFSKCAFKTFQPEPPLSK